LYGGSIRLFFFFFKKNGIRTTLFGTGDLAAVKSAINEHTKAIFVETPTNPMMQVTDISAIAEIAHEHGALLIVDNTFLTPYFQRPLTLGADIVVHSGTKYLGGHNDTLAGFLITNSHDLAEKLRFIYKTTGACLAPFDSWLMIRGIKTLAVRLKQQEKSAITIANWLQNQPAVKAVYFSGLASHAGYEITRRQSSGFGGMISFEVESEEFAKQILSRIKLIGFAESLGGTESLMTYPYTQTHADVPEEHRQKKGITARLLRLSVGLEDTDDLIEDLRGAICTTLTK
jgi:cystathionine beta-lyase/cystathionine gamma-synthase